MSTTDLHFHLLPAVDDGPAGLPEAVDLARAALDDGSELVVATPHVHPDWVDGPLELAERVRELRAGLGAAGVELQVECGGELDYRLVERLDQGELDAIAHGPPHARWLLLETPFEGIGERFHAAADELRERGFGILLAHPERSADVILDEGAGLRRELAEGALVQVTAASLSGGHGSAARAAALGMLAEGLVTLIASDAHGPTRPPALSAARRELAQSFGERRAELLVGDAPRRLLALGVAPSGSLAA